MWRSISARTPALRSAARGEPGVEVPEPFFRHPHVREQDLHRRPVRVPALDELHRRDADPLLVDLRRRARHRAGDRAAHVRPVLAHRREEHPDAIVEDRIDQRNVVQVGAAEVRIVGDHDVARRKIGAEPLQRRLHRPGQRDDVRADVLGLRHDLATGIEQPAREVARLVDGHRARGTEHRGAHLAHDGNEALGDDFEGDRIDAGHVGGSPAGLEDHAGVLRTGSKDLTYPAVM